MQEINNPFKPSIKLLPLIKINKQNAENGIAKILLLKITSNSSILDEFILISNITTNNKIKTHWIKNLFLVKQEFFYLKKTN